MSVQFGTNHGLVQVADHIEVAKNPASYEAFSTPELATHRARFVSSMDSLVDLESAAVKDVFLLTFLPMTPVVGLTSAGWLPASWVFPAFLVSLVLCGMGNLWGRVRLASIVARRRRLQQKIEAIEKHLNDRHDWDPE